MAKKPAEMPAVGALTTIDPAMLADIVAALVKAQGAVAAPVNAQGAVKAQGDLVTGLTVTVTQNGKSWVSKNGNPMIAVKGTLANGARVGGSLWIKV